VIPRVTFIEASCSDSVMAALSSSRCTACSLWRFVWRLIGSIVIIQILRIPAGAFSAGNQMVTGADGPGSVATIDPNANPNELIDGQITFIRNLLSNLPDTKQNSMKSADLWRRLGLLLQTKDIRQHIGGGVLQPEALEAFDKALRLNDDRDYGISYQVYEHRGILLKMMGRGEEAIISHNFAIEYAANKVEKCEAMSNKAAALVMLGRVSQAAALYRETVSLCKDKTSYFLPLVQCYLELGRLNSSTWSDLLVTIEVALPERERYNYLALEYSGSGETTELRNSQSMVQMGADGVALSLDDVDGDDLADEGPSAANNINNFNINHGSSIYWALYEVAHKLSHYDKAWFYLEKAHVVEAMHRKTDTNLEESITTQVSQIKSIFTPSFWPTGVGLDTKAPVFIVGMMRSGSTLLETMLDAHPNIWGMGEDSLFNGRLNSFRTDLVAAASQHNEVRKVVSKHGNVIVKEMMKLAETTEQAQKYVPANVKNKRKKTRNRG
jgi:tetratricopeptide (TPR) repeat protein